MENGNIVERMIVRDLIRHCTNVPQFYDEKVWIYFENSGRIVDRFFIVDGSSIDQLQDGTILLKITDVLIFAYSDAVTFPDPIISCLYPSDLESHHFCARGAYNVFKVFALSAL